MAINGYEVSFGVDGSALKLIMVIITQLYKYT